VTDDDEQHVVFKLARPGRGKYGRRVAGHTHLIDFPEALEAFFSRVGELKHALGAKGAEQVGAIEVLIAEGLAARDRGDQATAIARIIEAMRRLADAAADSGTPEAAMLRMMAERFREAMVHADLSQAKDAAETMRVRSGSTVHPKKPS
jgi:hypothetical protein